LRQEDREFKASLGYIVRTYLKRINNNQVIDAGQAPKLSTAHQLRINDFLA
jgi:hypothetical protein